MRSISKVDYTYQNEVSLIRAGKAYFSKMLQLIEAANYTIHLQVYIFEDDETGNLIAESLIKAAIRKVKVYLLVDAYASQGLSSTFIRRLNMAGINFRRFSPILRSKYFYFGRRLHHKVLVVDSYHSLVAGMNISNHYNDLNGQPAWLDWAVYVQGEISAQLQEICIRRYQPSQQEILTFRKTPEYKLPKAQCKVRVSVNDWVKGKMEITESYKQMFQQAQQCIYLMSPYFLPGNELMKAIAEAAQRGVIINLILPGISDVQMAKHAERHMYRWFFKKHINIYEYQPKVLHGKMALCDGKWLTIGSYNVNNISAYASIELNLDILDETFAGEAEQRLKRIIDIDCIRVEEYEYMRKMNFFRLLLQKSSYEIIRLLLYLFTFYFKQRE